MVSRHGAQGVTANSPFPIETISLLETKGSMRKRPTRESGFQFDQL